MELIETPLLDAKIIVPRVFEDERGYFYESFNAQNFKDHLGKYDFVQDNQSLSQKGVLRGLHFQNPPFAEIKIVFCIIPTYGTFPSYFWRTKGLTLFLVVDPMLSLL